MLYNGIYVFRNLFFTHALATNEKKEGSSTGVELKPFKTEAIKEKALWTIEYLGDQIYRIVNVYHYKALLRNDDGSLRVAEFDKDSLKQKWKLDYSGYQFFLIIDAETSGTNIDTQESNVLLQPVTDDDENWSCFWDIQYIRESYYAIRSLKNGQFLYAGKDEKLKLKDCGTPREFLWNLYYNRYEKSCYLRNVKTDSFLQILDGDKEKVEVVEHDYDPWFINGLPEQMRWVTTKTEEENVLIINQALNPVIQRNACLQIEHTDEMNKEMELRTYSVSWHKHDTNSPPPQSLWTFEKVAPSDSYVVHPYIELDGGLEDIAAEIASGKTTAQLRQEAIDKRSMTSVLTSLEFQTDTIQVMTPAPPPVGRDDSPSPGSTTVIRDMSRTDSKMRVPNSGRFYRLEDIALESSWKAELLERQVIETVRKINGMDRVLRDVVTSETTELQQKLLASIEQLRADMLTLITPDLIDRLMAPLKVIIDQTVQEQLVPIRTSLSVIEAQVKALEKDDH